MYADVGCKIADFVNRIDANSDQKHSRIAYPGIQKAAFLHGTVRTQSPRS
jgi:hypothetical protein